MTKGTNWYVVYTRAHAEQQAAIHLGNQGFNVYLPRYNRTRRHARKTETVLRPLFPRYLFVELDLTARGWQAVNNTRGVRYLLTQGDKPVPVPEVVMTELRKRETADGSILLTQPTIRKGERLKIMNGALENTIGLFERMADKNRALLLLDILGRSVRVQAPLHTLAPVLFSA